MGPRQTYRSQLVVDIYRDGRYWEGPASSGDRDYTKLVIEDEWPKMVDGTHSVEADYAIEKIAPRHRSLEPKWRPTDPHRMLAALGQPCGSKWHASRWCDRPNPTSGWCSRAARSIAVGFSFLFPFKRRRMVVIMVGCSRFSIAIVFYLTTASTIRSMATSRSKRTHSRTRSRPGAIDHAND